MKRRNLGIYLPLVAFFVAFSSTLLAAEERSLDAVRLGSIDALLQQLGDGIWQSATKAMGPKADTLEMAELDYLATIATAYHMLKVARFAATQAAIQVASNDCMLAGAFEASMASQFDKALYVMTEVAVAYGVDAAWQGAVLHETHAAALEAAQELTSCNAWQASEDSGRAAYAAAEHGAWGYFATKGAQVWERLYADIKLTIELEGLVASKHQLIALGIEWTSEESANPFLEPFVRLIRFARDRVPLWLA